MAFLLDQKNRIYDSSSKLLLHIIHSHNSGEKMKQVSIVLLTLLALSAFAELEDQRWNGANTPTIFDGTFNYSFDLLPLNGDIGKTSGRGWSGSYWPAYKGGIAFRWNHPSPNNFKYKSPGLSSLNSMSQDQIAQLSPSEKYDILMGRYDFPLTKKALDMNDEDAKDWRGICHGWAPASLHYTEPAPVTVVNRDGITIPFGSSDVKAMLSFYYAWDAKSQTKQISKRCFGKFNLVGSCKGVNPGSFHVVLSNLIGVRKEGFLADVDRYKEVWNQAIVSFSTQILGYPKVKRKHKRKGIAKLISVKTIMEYVNEIDGNAGNPNAEFEDTPMWNPVFNTIFQERTMKEYYYTLELDAYGKIIGGDWNGDDRPDFLWTMKKAPFNGYYSGISEIYKPIF